MEIVRYNIPKLPRNKYNALNKIISVGGSSNSYTYNQSFMI
jgi:hypothetical protein